MATTTIFSIELQLATAAPALANGALLVAEGNVQKYMDAIKVLYQANSLPCPNLTPLLDMIIVTPPSTPLLHVVMDTPPIFLTDKNSSLLYKADESALDANTCGEVTKYHGVEEVPIINFNNTVELQQETPAAQSEQDTWSPLSNMNQSPVMPVQDEQDEEWMPLSRLSEIPSTPLLNKIGITNPSPGAYYYLDLMARNKRLLFRDSPNASSFLDNDRVSFSNNVLGDQFSRLTEQHNTPISLVRQLESITFTQQEVNGCDTGTHSNDRPGLKRGAWKAHNRYESEACLGTAGKRTRNENTMNSLPKWR